MNKKSRPKFQENPKNLFTLNPNTRVPARLTGHKSTSKNAAGIEKALAYKIFTTVRKPDTPRKTVIRETGKKNQGTTRTKITKINAIISK